MTTNPATEADIKRHLMKARQALVGVYEGSQIEDVRLAVDHLIDAVDALDDARTKTVDQQVKSHTCPEV